MELVEISLLIITYTVLILALFLEIICYKRNLETLETIGFTASLLLLIVSITTSYFFDINNTSETNVYILVSMVLVALTTPLNIYEERIHTIKTVYKKALITFSIVLILIVIIGYFLNLLVFLQYIIAFFLGISIFFSMVFIKKTKPKIKIAYREKAERYFATALLIFTPLTLIADFSTDVDNSNIKIGFTLPIIFTLMAANKLWDDIKRLSLLNSENNIKEQNLINYSLTNREKEVALLLVEGKTYKQISERLNISLPTVKSHTYNIYKKCKINNKIELISLLSN